MSLGDKIIFSGVWDIHKNIYNSICENKINFMNLLVITYRGRTHPFERLPPIILTGLICPSDTRKWVLFICYIMPFKNHIVIYEDTRSYKFYEI